MKHIQHSRRQPYIGPVQSKAPRQVVTALTVTAAAFALAWAATWIACELKKLS